MIQINFPTRNNEKLIRLLELVNNDAEAFALWEACNVMTVKRQGISDHGPVHVNIVSNIALKLLRNLHAKEIHPSIVKDWEFEQEDAEVIVALAALFHDVGNAVHRDLHDQLGPILAGKFIEKYLSELYEPRERQIMLTEVFSAMVSHSEDKYPPMTLEAGIIRLADALDMEKGRARIAYEAGSKDIHSISAMSIDEVKIGDGERPIEIEVKMNNPAGIFQVDFLLKKKLKGTGLEPYVKVKAIIHQHEENFIDEYVIE